MGKIARGKVSGWGRGAVIVISSYRRFLSPWLPPSCRFIPTCSVYASEAVERYGLLRGIWLGLRRLLRCHSRNPGGYDPVR